MSSEEWLWEVQKSQRERERLLADRSAHLAGRSSFIPDDLFSDRGLPRFPWIWYRGGLVVLRPGGTGEGPHVSP